MANEVDVRVVFYKDANTWVAQCIEYDIAAFAETLRELPRAIERAIAANVCVNHDLGREGLDGIPGAPPRFGDMLRAGMRIDTRSTPFPTTSHPAVRIRELVLADAA